jgi:hypothetical protein
MLGKNIKFWYSMRLFMILCFLTTVLKAQTPCASDIQIRKIVPNGQGFIIKWSANYVPKNGILTLYRKQLNSEEKYKVTSITAANDHGEFGDTAVQSTRGFVYCLELLNNASCKDCKTTPGRAIDGADDSLNQSKVRYIDDFTQKDYYDIIPEKLNVKPNGFLKIRLHIKDFNFPFKTTSLYFYLVFGEKMYKTTYSSENDNDNGKTALVSITEKPSAQTTFKIAYVQDDFIIGLSPIIRLE